MTTPVKLALVGCGGIARAHLLGYKELFEKGCRDYEYVACCDTNEVNARERAEGVAAIQGFEPQIFNSIDDLIASGIAEAADCCLPHWMHHVGAVPLLEGGLHVLVEKPIGITVEATKVIAAAAKRTGRIAAVAEQIRRFRVARAFRWAIAEKRIIGDVLTARAYQIMDSPLDYEQYKFKWRGVKLLTGGGMIMDSGAHYADMMIHIFGEPDEILCTTHNFDECVIEDCPVLGTAAADVETTWNIMMGVCT